MKNNLSIRFIIQPSNWLSITLLIILCLFHIWFGIIPGLSNINSDFPNYYTSSKLLLEGKDLTNIYNDDWFQQKIYDYGMSELGKFSPFPPPTFFILVPEALLSPITAKRVFLLINVIGLIFAAYLVKKISKLNYINSLNIIFLSGAALANNFLLGQVYLILLVFVLLGYLSLIRREELPAGIFWGIGAAVKYFPLIYCPALIIKKNWKALGSLITSFLIINIIACFFLNIEVCRQFLTEVLPSHLNGELSSQSNFAVQFQSWNSFLRNVFVYDKAENNSPFIDSVFLFHFFRFFVYIIFPIVSMIVMYRLRKHPDFIPVSVSILTLLVFVLSPASASYHLLLMILPVVLLLSLSTKNNSVFSLIFISLFVLIGFSPFLSGKINWEAWGLFFQYHRLWLEIILYLVSAWYVLFKNKKPMNDFSVVR